MKLSADEREERRDWLNSWKTQGQSEFGRFVKRHFDFPWHGQAFIEGLRIHGIFFENRLYVDHFDEMMRMMIATPFDAEKFAALYFQMLRTRPQESEMEESVAASRLLRYFWEQQVAVSAGSSVARTAIRDWYAEMGGVKPCDLCGRHFDIVWLGLSPVFPGPGNHWCMSCELMEYPSREEMDERLLEFIEACGFTPHIYKDILMTPSFRARVGKERWFSMLRAYARMGGQDHVKQIYGSWFEGLAHSGCLPDGVLVGPRGYKCLARDGHVCRSLDEQYIDNWLFEHGVAHECEPRYPRHEALNSTGLIADWKVGDVYIEYFGLVGETAYNAKMVRKQLLAEALGLRLVSILPSNLGRLDEVLGDILTI